MQFLCQEKILLILFSLDFLELLDKLNLRNFFYEKKFFIKKIF